MRDSCINHTTKKTKIKSALQKLSNGKAVILGMMD